MGDRHGRPPSPTDEERRAAWDRLANSARSQKVFTKDSIKSPFWVEGVRLSEIRSTACSTRHPFWVTAKTRYELTEEIYLGDFSIIYKAKEEGSGRVLAVKKFIKFEDQYKSFRFRKVVEEQWRILDAVRGGPHVIAVGTIRNMENPMAHPEMPMEYYEYNLSYLLQKTRTERGLNNGFVYIPAFFHTVLHQMLKALNFLHCEKLMVTHGGVNPTNILFTNVNHFVLCDFGAAEMGPPLFSRRLDGMLEYLAPELYSHGRPDIAVDIWALGIVGLEMLGLVPVIGDQRDRFDMNKKLDWCTEMALFAELLEMPELKMMVVESVEERATASEVLRIMEEKPSRPKQRHRPSVECLTALLKYVGHLNLTSKGMRRDVAMGYLQGTDPARGAPEATEPAQRPAQAGQDAQYGDGSQYKVSSSTAEWTDEVWGNPKLPISDVLETLLPSSERPAEPGTRENPLGSTTPSATAASHTPEFLGRTMIMALAPKNVGMLAAAMLRIQEEGDLGNTGGRSSATSRLSPQVPALAQTPPMGLLAAILTEGAVERQRTGLLASTPATSKPADPRDTRKAPAGPQPSARSSQGGPSSSRQHAKGQDDKAPPLLTRPTTQSHQGEPRPRPPGGRIPSGSEAVGPQAKGEATQRSRSPHPRSGAQSQSAAGPSPRQHPRSAEAPVEHEGKSDTKLRAAQSAAPRAESSKPTPEKPSESPAPEPRRGQAQAQRGKAQRGRKRR